MTTRSEGLVDWVDSRLDELLTAPRMWGSTEAVEMQVLLLLEARWFSAGRGEPRHVFDTYLRYMSERFPSGASQPLFQQLGPEDYVGLAEHLATFRSFLFPECRQEREPVPDERALPMDEAERARQAQ